MTQWYIKSKSQLFSFIRSSIRSFYDWLESFIATPKAQIILGVMFYVEAICFLPAEPLLVIYCLENPKKSFYYATIAVLCSLLGGLTSYGIGALLWCWYGHHIVSVWPLSSFLSFEQWNTVRVLFKQYDYSAILVAGFMPIPFKITTFCAGLCHFSLAPFIISVGIIRAVRCYAIACITSNYKVYIKKSIEGCFGLVVFFILVIVSILFLAMRYSSMFINF